MRIKIGACTQRFRAYKLTAIEFCAVDMNLSFFAFRKRKKKYCAVGSAISRRDDHKLHIIINEKKNIGHLI